MSYKNTPIYKAHQLLGFPKFDKTTQFDIIINSDYSHIKNLCPEFSESEFPLGLLHEYITITTDELVEHLKSIDYITTKLNSWTDTYDGIWLRKANSIYELVYRERGTERAVDKFDNKHDVLVKLANSMCSFCKKN